MAIKLILILSFSFYVTLCEEIATHNDFTAIMCIILYIWTVINHNLWSGTTFFWANKTSNYLIKYN